MKRFRRWLFNVLAGVSLLLCVATAVLWVRSHHAWEDILFVQRLNEATGPRFVAFESISGRIIVNTGRLWWHGDLYPPGFVYDRQQPTSDPPPEVWDNPNDKLFEQRPAVEAPWWVRCGFGVSHDRWNEFASGPQITIGLPHWFVVLVTGVAPVLWLRMKVRCRRSGRHRRAGACIRCGYDLRATPGRCPECGTVAAKNEPISN